MLKKGANILAQEKVHFLGDVQERGKAQKELPGQNEINLTCLSLFASCLTRSLLLLLSLFSLVLSALLLSSTYVAFHTFMRDESLL